MHPDHMPDWMYQQYMDDQIAAHVLARFTCQVCKEELLVRERAENSFTDTCLSCDEEIARDMKELEL